MRIKGVLGSSHIRTFLREIGETKPDRAVLLDLEEVDRVEYGALAEILIIASDLAVKRRRLTIVYPSSKVLSNELRRIAEGRDAEPGTNEWYARRSVIKRVQRRPQLLRELARCGFHRALSQAYELQNYPEGLDPRNAPRPNTNDDGSLTAGYARHIPFAWIEASSGPANFIAELSPERLADVLSQRGELASAFDARSISDYVVSELLANVADHAFRGNETYAGLTLIGAVALWPGPDFGVATWSHFLAKESARTSLY